MGFATRHPPAWRGNLCAVLPLSSGSRLGTYEVLSPLGAGGMGEVHRARDTRLGREVAIKVLPADRLHDEHRRHRFLREAQSASALNHQHIITIHEIESAGDVDFIVMEYVRGRSLDALIPRHGMLLKELLDRRSEAHNGSRVQLRWKLVSRRPADCLSPPHA